jgi:predicted nucleic acid-binding protein
MGLLRLLTNPKVMGRAPRTVVQPWETFVQLRADRRSVFATEPEGVEPAWRQLMSHVGVGPSSWTDAYLAAFSEAHYYSLVTFDAGFNRWPAIKLTLLSTQKLPGK